MYIIGANIQQIGSQVLNTFEMLSIFFLLKLLFTFFKMIFHQICSNNNNIICLSVTCDGTAET